MTFGVGAAATAVSFLLLAVRNLFERAEEPAF
jgi:hypothetical protein